jgi:hypothetical protein
MLQTEWNRSLHTDFDYRDMLLHYITLVSTLTFERDSIAIEGVHCKNLMFTFCVTQKIDAEIFNIYLFWQFYSSQFPGNYRSY